MGGVHVEYKCSGAICWCDGLRLSICWCDGWLCVRGVTDVS
jgi:hypothetical protein